MQMLHRVSALSSQRLTSPVHLTKFRNSGPTCSVSRASAQMAAHKNVLGGELVPCADGCGYSRDGYCRVIDGDFGVHAVAAVVSVEFLTFTKAQGNDLSTPRPPSFPGLKDGDRWCLCASRWLEAQQNGKAPKVVLEATDAKALDIIPLELLQQYAA